MSNDENENGNGSGDRPGDVGRIAFDLVELGHVHGNLASVMRRLATGVPLADGPGAAELDWLLTEARGLDERARTIWETKIEPFLVEHAKRFSKGAPPIW